MAGIPFTEYEDLLRASSQNAAGGVKPSLTAPLPVEDPVTKANRLRAAGVARPTVAPVAGASFLSRAFGLPATIGVALATDLYSRADISKDGLATPGAIEGVSYAETRGGGVSGMQRPQVAQNGTPLLARMQNFPKTAAALESETKNVRAPEIEPTVTVGAAPATLAQVMAQQASDGQAAMGVDQRIDRLVGPGGYGANGGYIGADNINARARGFGVNPEARAAFNELQGLNRTGITMSRDANGQVLLSTDYNAPKRQYVGADGNPTTKWEETADYQQGLARAAADRAALAKIESDRQVNDAIATARTPATAARLNANVNMAQTLISAQAQRDNNAATTRVASAESQRKAQADQDKNFIDYMTAVANGDAKAAAAAKDRFALALSGQVLATDGPKAAAAALSGRPGPGLTVPLANQPTTGADKNMVTFDPATGVAKNVPVRQQGSIAKATDGKFYVLDAQGKATRAATPEEIARMK